jgi:hypothetical protein
MPKLSFGMILTCGKKGRIRFGEDAYRRVKFHTYWNIVTLTHGVDILGERRQPSRFYKLVSFGLHFSRIVMSLLLDVIAAKELVPFQKGIKCPSPTFLS